MASTVTVRVEDRELRLSNLEKELFPDVGLTKAGVIDYYRQVAPVLLPHLADRVATFYRCPNGVGQPGFFDKDAARYAPSWVRTVAVSTSDPPEQDPPGYAVLRGLPDLVWAANLAALELHVPQWTVGPRGGRRTPNLLVFDLDPGAPATIMECCRVALLLRDRLASDGLTGYAKTSGSKGLQVYVPVTTKRTDETNVYARALAEELTGRYADDVVAKMTKSLRAGKVLVDWSQNNPAKTTVAPYSLRARAEATVSTPVTWEEVAACEAAEELRFDTADVVDRVDRLGDLMAPLLTPGPRLPRL